MSCMTVCWRWLSPTKSKSTNCHTCVTLKFEQLSHVWHWTVQCHTCDSSMSHEWHWTLQCHTCDSSVLHVWHWTVTHVTLNSSVSHVWQFNVTRVTLNTSMSHVQQFSVTCGIELSHMRHWAVTCVTVRRHLASVISWDIQFWEWHMMIAWWIVGSHRAVHTICKHIKIHRDCWRWATEQLLNFTANDCITAGYFWAFADTGWHHATAWETGRSTAHSGVPRTKPRGKDTQRYQCCRCQSASVYTRLKAFHM